MWFGKEVQRLSWSIFFIALTTLAQAGDFKKFSDEHKAKMKDHLFQKWNGYQTQVSLGERNLNVAKKLKGKTKEAKIKSAEEQIKIYTEKSKEVWAEREKLDQGFYIPDVPLYAEVGRFGLLKGQVVAISAKGMIVKVKGNFDNSVPEGEIFVEELEGIQKLVGKEYKAEDVKAGDKVFINHPFEIVDKHEGTFLAKKVDLEKYK